MLLFLVNTVFPLFKFGASDLQFVSKFKYLGNIITMMKIYKEKYVLFVRCNHLIRRFIRVQSVLN